MISHPVVLLGWIVGEKGLGGLPDILGYMDEVHQDRYVEVPLLGQLCKKFDLCLVAIYQSHPLLLPVRVAMRCFFEHRRDDFLGGAFEACPDTFLFRPGTYRHFLRLLLRQDLLRRAHKRFDGIDGGYRGHAFGVQPSTAPQPRGEGLVPFSGGFPRGLAQILGQHSYALTVDGEHQDGPVTGLFACVALAVSVKSFEVLGRTNRQFFELPLGNVGAGIGLKRLDPFVKGALGGFDGHAPPYFQRILFIREIQRSVERMQTVLSLAGISGAGQFQGAEDALHSARMLRGAGACLALCILHRPSSLCCSAPVQMLLQQQAHQFAPLFVQQPLQVAVLHLVRLTE